MIPADISQVSMAEFYKLIAMARVSRRMYQEDQETAIIGAINRIFEAMKT